MPAAPESLGAQLHRLALLADSARRPAVVDLQSRLSAGRLRVLLAGEAKRGKSTVGNAVLARDVLPAGVTPLTAVTTEVRVAPPGTGERVDLHLVDGTRVTTSVDRLADWVTEVGNPRNRRQVATATVLLEASALPSAVELVDTPGMGSVLPHNTDEAEAALRRMDVAVLVLTADPPISASEQQLLRDVRALSVRTYVLLNKIDRLDSDEQEQAQKFTQHVLAVTLDGVAVDVPLFPCSARQALQARLSGDDDAYRASGLAAFTDMLEDLSETGASRELRTSVASTAHRICSELLDDARITRRAAQLQAQDETEQLATFTVRVRQLSRRRQDAAAILTADTAALLRALDADAATTARYISQHARAVVTRHTATGAIATAELERAGLDAVETTVRGDLDTWRAQWQERIQDALQDMARRQQEQLSAAVADIADAARELLAVDLQWSPPPVRLPDTSTFRYTFSPEIGWNEPVAAGVRRRLPRGVGRRRVTRYLDSEAGRTADKHTGRARADFQARIQDTSRTLARTVDSTYTDWMQRLTTALQAANDADASPAGDRDRNDEQVEALESLARDLSTGPAA